jgi:DNA polymerase III epsilon subunit family exonuclease
MRFRLPWRRSTEHDTRSLDVLMTEGFVAIDLETTGLDPARDAIVELAAIHFAGGRPGRVYLTRIDPGGPIRPESSRVHGITDDMVAGAPPIRDALVGLEQVCAGHVLVGHGVGFDLAILGRERRANALAPMTNPTLDTMLLAGALHPDWVRQSLDEIAARVGIGILGRHTAEGDARAAGELFVTLLHESRERGVRTVGELAWLQHTVPRGWI